MWFEKIEAKKVHTAPGMYTIEVVATVEADKADPAFLGYYTDGANEECQINNISCDGEVPYEYAKAFTILKSVAKTLDEEI